MHAAIATALLMRPRSSRTAAIILEAAERAHTTGATLIMAESVRISRRRGMLIVGGTVAVRATIHVAGLLLLSLIPALTAGIA